MRETLEPDPGEAHRSQPIEKIREDTDRNFFMSADAAQEYGIVDEVIAKRGD